MDYGKIQAEAIKKKLNNNSVYLAVDGAAIFIIPEDSYFLDLRESPCPKIMQIFSDFIKAHHTKVKLSCERYCADGKTLVAFKSEDHVVWFDEKILKKFDALNRIEIVSSGELSPAGVYSVNGSIMGIISPRRIHNYGKNSKNE